MTGVTKIRKQVATIANRLYKKLKNLSTAFKRAWQIVKGRELITKLAGVTFGNRQKALAKLQSYDAGMVNVSLVREANNEHDTNAIAVNVSVGSGAAYNLGYIPKELAVVLAPLIDKGLQLVSRFVEVRGGEWDKPIYGGVIAIEL